jgi:1D-myo-inositol-triphosphate 3-kinase
MVWRETISTTSTFGFRIEGVRKSGVNGYSTKDFKTTRSEAQVLDAFLKFTQGCGSHVATQYLERLQDLRAALAQSQFFATHEVSYSWRPFPSVYLALETRPEKPP